MAIENTKQTVYVVRSLAVSFTLAVFKLSIVVIRHDSGIFLDVNTMDTI